MTPKKFKTMRAGRGGWSEWVFPKQESYLFKCCDCGLVHEMQFKAFVEKNQKRGTFEVIKLPEPLRAMFRARRHPIYRKLRGFAGAVRSLPSKPAKKKTS